MKPLVSVIALAYNHASFVREALNSLADQSYTNFEVIIIDDASSDATVQEILEFKKRRPDWHYIFHSINRGNCVSFNEALALAKGDYIIDFATDDVMMKNRLERQVEFFKSLPDSCGLVHSDALIIDSHGAALRKHSDRVKHIPSGIIYTELLAEYLICPPTMMFRREMLEEAQGYDESLPFEDFDLWMRTSRSWEYYYQPEVLTHYRQVPSSLSHRFKEHAHLHAAIATICEREFSLLKSSAEKKAMRKRLNIQLREAHRAGAMSVVRRFQTMLNQLGGVDWKSRLLLMVQS